MFYEYLAAKGQSIILFNCKLFETHILCGCALFFTNTPQRLFYNKELVNNGKKLLLPKDLQIETFAKLNDITNNIRLFFEESA